MRKFSRTFMFVSLTLLLLSGGTIGYVASEEPASWVETLIGNKTAQADQHDEPEQINQEQMNGVEHDADEAKAHVNKAADKESSTTTVVAQKTEETITSLTNDVANELLTSFMGRLVQEVDDNYRVKGYDSKEALLKMFASIADEQLAKKFIDYYYEERNGALYIIPTELPPWVELGNEYDLKQLNENEYKLTQENKSDLYGMYTIHVTFTFENGKWLISDVQYE